MKPRYQDKTFRVCRPCAQLCRGGTEPYDYLEGNVTTPHHIVLCFARDNYSHLELLHAGKRYRREFDTRLTARQLAIYAGRFSREMAEGQEKHL